MSNKKVELAVIETGGKQFIVNVGTVVSVEKLENETNKVTLDNVLLYSDGKDVKVGTPTLDGFNVTAEILAQEKDEKVRVFKFKKKTGYKKKQGHRQRYSTIKIVAINSSSAKKSTSSAKTKKDDPVK